MRSLNKNLLLSQTSYLGEKRFFFRERQEGSTLKIRETTFIRANEQTIGLTYLEPFAEAPRGTQHFRTNKTIVSSPWN